MSPESPTRADYTDVIGIIGPNPAVDYTLEVPHLAVGTVHRTGTSFRVAGGKPLNVARTIVRLGGHARVIMPLGGSAGDFVAAGARALEIEVEALDISEETRTAVILADPVSRTQTVINEVGPHLSPTEASAYGALCLTAVRSASLVLCSGSVPPGLPPDLYASVAGEAAHLETPCIVDTSGEALRAAIGASAWGIKVNAEELCAVAGSDDALSAAQRVRAEGVLHVIVTLGADGALYVGPKGVLRVDPARIVAANAVASGDAFLGALAFALQRGDPWPDALRLASAVSGLAASLPGPDIGPHPQVEDLLADIQCLRPE